MLPKDSEVQSRLFKFIDTSPSVYALFNEEDALVYCNSAFAEIFGTEPENILGLTFAKLITQAYEKKQGLRIESESLDSWLQYVETVRRQQPFRSFEADLTDGRWLLFSEQLNEQGELFVHASDITEQKQLSDRTQQSNEKLRHLALDDELTLIPNRKHFINASRAELNRCWRAGKQAALIIMTADNIKSLIDKKGVTAATEALKHIAHIIRKTLREYDLFGRVGSEELAIFLGQSDATLAPQIATRIGLQVEANPLLFNNEDIPLTLSIGLSLQPSDTPYTQLFEQAEKAMHVAISKGRNRVESYVKEQ